MKWENGAFWEENLRFLIEWILYFWKRSKIYQILVKKGKISKLQKAVYLVLFIGWHRCENNLILYYIFRVRNLWEQTRIRAEYLKDIFWIHISLQPPWLVFQCFWHGYMLYGLDATNLRKFFCNIWAAFGGKAPGKGLTRKMINIQCDTAKAGFYIVQATCNIKTIKGRIYNDHMYTIVI